MEASESTATQPAQVPPEEAPEWLRTVIADQQQNRAEISRLREELGQRQVRPTPAISIPAESPEDRLKDRLEAIADHSHYCPGCGRLSRYVRECTGTPAAPHPPIEAVPTDELSGDGDPSNHTAAPASV